MRDEFRSIDDLLEDIDLLIELETELRDAPGRWGAPQ